MFVILNSLHCYLLWPLYLALNVFIKFIFNFHQLFAPPFNFFPFSLILILFPLRRMRTRVYPSGPNKPSTQSGNSNHNCRDIYSNNQEITSNCWCLYWNGSVHNNPSTAYCCQFTEILLPYKITIGYRWWYDMSLPAIQLHLSSKFLSVTGWSALLLSIYPVIWISHWNY